MLPNKIGENRVDQFTDILINTHCSIAHSFGVDNNVTSTVDTFHLFA